MNRSAYDRFQPPPDREETTAETLAFENGAKHRRDRCSLAFNPHRPWSVLWRAWEAGWCDADQAIAADHDGQENG